MTSQSPNYTYSDTSKFVQTSKWRIHYNEMGEGFPLILLHGSGPGATSWSNFHGNTGLASKYRLILMDFPGWGESDEADAVSAHRVLINAESVKLLMDELGIEKAALVGNSMGGAAALMFATLYPERMSHLISMGARAPHGAPAYYEPAGLSEGLRISYEVYADPTPENFRRQCLNMLYDPALVTDALIEQRMASALQNRNHIHNYLDALERGPKIVPEMQVLGERLAQSKIPALILHGRDDRVVSVEHGMRTASIIPNSALVVFNRCGHWAQLEHRDEFNAILDGFVSATMA